MLRTPTFPLGECRQCRQKTARLQQKTNNRNMEQFLPNVLAAEKAFSGRPGRVFRTGFSFYSFVFSFLLLGLMSNGAIASHFKGGYFSYNYLGEGKYEILITGYWDKSEVGYIAPRYEGYPTKEDSPETLSQTLLEDGETIEHVQRQIVTWSKPGVYKIYWRSCCREEGSNFGHNFMGLYAAVNYTPEAPSSSPQFFDDRSFDFNSKQRINYSLQMEDPEGHEQDFSLELPFGLSANVYDRMLESGFQLTANGKIIWEDPLEGSWLLNIRLREKINGVYTGAYIDREIIIKVNAPGKKPDKKGMKAENNVTAEELALPAEATVGVKIYPNPINDLAQLKVVLEEADWVRVDIIDLSGRVIKELYHGNIAAKEELTLEIDSRQLGTNKLLVGRLISTKGVQTFKLVMQ